ncbi:MAG: vitamin K epoxide reductase family protein [Anaerolineae bacterium]|nr:vitamin K epoxide reductase family protein [Anaerolineae bacterium]
MRHDWQLRVIQLIAVVGLLVAYYLLLFHNGVLLSGCTDSGWDDCGAVSGPGAPYASVGPIPVALIGLLGYAVIFALTWLKDWAPLRESYLPELLVGAAGFGFLFTLVLTGLEAFVIHAFCRYCLVSAVLITIIFVLAISYLRSEQAET